jgi:hypothetical protein
MKKIARSAVVIAVSTVTLWLLFETSAWAVPSYSRRYGVECSTCHTMWGALTGAGATFRLSGYRAINGKPMKPETEDIEISKGVTIPSTLPLSFITGVGVDSRSEKRDVSGAGGSSGTSNGFSLALEDASIFMTSPLGEHLSAFVEFPMYETRAWEFTPTGNFEARYNTSPGRQIQFSTESPAFEVAKFFWNNPFGDSTPRDSVNFLAGITHLPMGYATGKVRLSVNQYLIYERTALDLLSPRKVDGAVGGDPNDFLFRLSEPQILAEVNGMLTFGKAVTDVAKRDTFWAEYHLGVTNGSNAKADNNTKKDVYGRWVMRWYNQTLGFFGIHSADSYSDNLRTTASTNVNTPGGTGVMSGAQDPNKTSRFGPDFTLSLVPFGIPVWLENAVMFNRESNPTGFGQEFKWKGGLNQLNWQISKTSIAYARYDWLRGDSFNDTTSTVNGNTGITNSTPKEHDFIIGWQHLYEQNIKLVAEARYHVFDDTASGGPIAALGGAATTSARLSDHGFTLRAMFGF